MQDGELVTLDFVTNMPMIHTTIVDLSIMEYAKRRNVRAYGLLTLHLPFSDDFRKGDEFVELAIKLLGIDKMVVGAGIERLATIESLSDGYVYINRFV